MKISRFFIVAPFALIGCYASESHPASITKIAERDGFTVYRFFDGITADPRYFVSDQHGKSKMIGDPKHEPPPEKVDQEK